MQTFTIKITGTSPLLMHNARLVDPLNPYTRELSERAAEYKKTKTAESLTQLYKAEWSGSLYYDAVHKMHLPTANIKASLIRGGVMVGRKGTAVKAGVHFSEVAVEFLYEGPEDLDALWKDERFRDVRSVVVGQNRVQRCRPKFDAWGVVASGFFEEETIDLADLERVVERAGIGAGLGDYRPEKGGPFGRFEAVITVTD